MRGRLYGVGVGPGDPLLLTLKAVRVLEAVPVIALPALSKKGCAAYQTAVRAVPSLEEKEALFLSFPMAEEKALLEEAHREAARKVEGVLEEGKDVAFLTIGDPGIYSTFSYLRPLLQADGYEVESICGVPSFCACAAALSLPLVQGREALHILPGEVPAEAPPGTLVILKGGDQLLRTATELSERGYETGAVVDCGKEGQRVYPSPSQMPEKSGYFTLIIAREGEKKGNL